MTSKNIDKVAVTVKNRQVIDGETDIISERCNGTIRCKNGVYFIMYKTESDTVMIKLDKDVVNVRRTGSSSSDIEYKIGKKTEFLYNTPYGAINMEIYTKSVQWDFSETVGKIRLVYDFYAGGGDCIKNDMQIEIRH